PLIELVQDFASSALSDEDAYNMTVAVDEAVTNIITHAYKNDPTGKITVSFGAKKDEVYVTIEDFSKNFIPPLLVEKKKFSFDKLEEGGLGLYLMQEFMDELRFLYDNRENKNILIMKKYLIN
ncbi:MAG: hypothetical protein CVV50_05405, partial [Spirochaetae bacterium HGW-Spirochaetae-6]